ncbi:hypothetical protein PGTUg99_014495 [Puccinia graminis f. sp. tritici]|uniref:Uncharacterized protein n=2 Tax=Puccinia graminis f. sp. tritici TaxID=56615 RepID=A0A5B0LST6_PUCGR|nr:hypothetical protein PGTUg99_014495 [Puccinia graminis f. sp. tritici]
MGPPDPTQSDLPPGTTKRPNAFLPNGGVAIARTQPFRGAAGRGRIVSTSTRKQNRSHEEIDAALALTAAKKAERDKKAAQKMESRRQNAAAKEARAAMKVSDKSTPIPRFVWSDEASLELLRFVKELKEDHDDLSARTPGFIAWTPFFLKNEVGGECYPLLEGIANDAILRRYRVLMSLWKVVYDKLSHSGSKGLHEVLVKENMSETTWAFITDMHGDNAAVNAYGHVELGTDMNELVADPGPESLLPESTHPIGDPSEDAERQRDRLGEAGLTAEELALDASDADDGPPASGSGPPPATPTSTLTPAIVRAPPTAPTTPKPPGSSQPTTRRRGRNEPVKPEDTTSHALILMLQNSQSRQEETRREDLVLAEKRANPKDEARAEAIAQAKHDREQAELLMKIEHTKALVLAQEAADERRAREEDRKEERRADQERRAEEKQASQLFQTAMLGMLARLGGGVGPAPGGMGPPPSGAGGSAGSVVKPHVVL